MLEPLEQQQGSVFRLNLGAGIDKLCDEKSPHLIGERGSALAVGIEREPTHWATEVHAADATNSCRQQQPCARA